MKTEVWFVSKNDVAPRGEIRFIVAVFMPLCKLLF